MKKNLYLIVTTMILAAALSSCQKDLGKPAQDDISPEDLAMAKKITSFITRMNDVSKMSHSNLKSSGVMSVDDALWNVEAAMNYTFADIPEQFGDTQVDTLAFTLSVENGFCRESDLSALYQSVDAAVQEYCSTLDEYQVLGVAVAMSDEVAGSITVSVISGINSGGLCDFEPGNDSDHLWHSGLGNGNCANDPQYKGRDAATETKKKANICKQLYPHNYYFTDVYIKTFKGLDLPNPNYDPQGDPYPYYKKYLFYRDTVAAGSLGTACLYPERLNFHLANLRHYANNVWKPAGKDLISYHYEFAHSILQYSDWYGYDYYVEWHQGTVTYGIPHKGAIIFPDPEK